MDDKKKIIDLGDLLDEVSRDLEDVRKRNPNDYSLKSTVLWWSMERSTLVLRHSPSSVMKVARRKWATKWVLTAFLSGPALTIALYAVFRLLVK